mgnify:FL=1
MTTVERGEAQSGRGGKAIFGPAKDSDLPDLPMESCISHSNRIIKQETQDVKIVFNADRRWTVSILHNTPCILYVFFFIFSLIC